MLALTTGKMPKTHYYTEENGKVIKDTITLEGSDWTFEQHQSTEFIPNNDDFKEVITSYLNFKIGRLMKKAGEK